MSNVIKLKLSFISRIRVWLNNYRKNVSNRLEYLKKKSKE